MAVAQRFDVTESDFPPKGPQTAAPRWLPRWVVVSRFKSGGICCLCGRATKDGTTEHHLIPRQCHSNKWFKKNFTRQQMQATISVCRPCHNAIHRFIPKHKELARHYNTKQALMQHEEISGFVQWVRKQK